LIPLAFAGWFGMNNIRTQEVTPEIAGGTIGAFSRITAMLLVGFAAAACGLYFILPAPSGLGLPTWTKWIVLLGVINATVLLLYPLFYQARPAGSRRLSPVGKTSTVATSRRIYPLSSPTIR
jgi:NNP family nitrate/nitrite transporter-like MFS transporter